jgi:hypothetical protein
MVCGNRLEFHRLGGQDRATSLGSPKLASTVTVRAAVRYLLRGATAAGRARGDIVQEIISIVRQVSTLPLMAGECPSLLC